MTPEYVDASDLIQPDTRSDAQKWLDAEMDKRWANEQGAEPYPILESIALEVIEDNQRLRAQIGQGEPVAWGQWEAIGLGDEPMRLVVKESAPTDHEKRIANWFRLYTHPAPQQKPLTDEQIDGVYRDVWSTVTHSKRLIAFARAIEAAHNIGEKK